jgi:hypothetical protein
VENLEDRISAVRRFNRFFTRQIGAECQRVLVMVVNGAQVEAVVQGEHGLLQTMTRGTILVCSTITLAELHRVAVHAAAQGVTVIDTPVSGGSMAQPRCWAPNSASGGARPAVAEQGAGAKRRRRVGEKGLWNSYPSLP